MQHQLLQKKFHHYGFHYDANQPDAIQFTKKTIKKHLLDLGYLVSVK